MSERKCTIEGCSDKHKARGLCNIHYRRLMRSGDPAGVRFKVPPSDEMKWCPRCRAFVEKALFGVSRARRDGLTSYCRPCIKVVVVERDPDGAMRRAHSLKHRQTDAARRYQREWKRREKQQDPQRVRARRKKWEQQRRDVLKAGWARNTPRRRARKLAAPSIPFTDRQLDARLAYFGNRCWMCGAAADSIDHVKPLAKGGAHMLANLRPACASCNARKGARWPFNTSLRRTVTA